MRRTSFALLAATAAAAGCAGEAQVTEPPASVRAQAQAEVRYDIVKLADSLGGTVRVGTGINNRGWIAGYSTLPGNGSRHAALWRDGAITDLGTLGGPGASSSVQWPGLANSGLVVGISQTSTPDPNDEDWSCAAFIGASPFTCVGFVYEDGVMTPLPTLGGPNGFATMANSRGQVVGWAETLVEDPTCDPGSKQVLQFRAVLWEHRRGLVRQLPPLPGDSTSAATAINERGQVVGISGDCGVAVGDRSARHAVLWEHGVPRKLPVGADPSWNTPMDINAAGDVAGFANRGGGLLYAFLWTGGTTSVDLAERREGLDGDTFSQAYGINARRQVVGRSCTGAGTGCKAFVWEDGVMRNLNRLLGPAFADSVTLARHVNDAGVIVGDLIEAGTGRRLVFVATPRGRD
jgi:probable HAF family extracellular repeat protein